MEDIVQQHSPERITKGELNPDLFPTDYPTVLAFRKEMAKERIQKALGVSQIIGGLSNTALGCLLGAIPLLLPCIASLISGIVYIICGSFSLTAVKFSKQCHVRALISLNMLCAAFAVISLRVHWTTFHSGPPGTPSLSSSPSCITVYLLAMNVFVLVITVPLFVFTYEAMSTSSESAHSQVDESHRARYL